MRDAVGVNIKLRREALGLTQAELAEKVVQNAERGSYISLVENGKVAIDVVRLGEFASALCCQPSDLLLAVRYEIAEADSA